MEKFFERMRSTMPADIVTAGSDASRALWMDRSSLPGDNDVATLSEILLAHPPELEYLITHSKGSLVASYALQQYVEDLEGDESALFERLRITTLGAVVGLPAAFKNVKQYLGALDWFGRANSSLGVMHERVAGVGHHLNPGFPYHMSVAALLNVGAAPRLLPKPALEELLAPLSILPAKEPVRKLPKKMAKPAAAAPRVVSPAPRIVSSTAKPASAAAKVARPAPKIVSAAPKSTAAEARQPSVAAKQAIKPVPKKVPVPPHRPVPPIKAKTAAANGKLMVKKSKKEVR